MQGDVDFELEEYIQSDKKRRELIIKTDELRKKKNEVALEIGKRKKAGQDTLEILNEMKIVSSELSNLELEQEENENQYLKYASTIPNFIHDSVPIGKDENDNKEIRKWGEIPSFDFDIHDHIDISEKLGIVDLERAAKVAGARFYYLKNDLARLNQSLIHFALDFLSQKEYSIVQPPYMIKQRINGRSSDCR